MTTKYKDRNRDKAWLGAVIGAAASIGGGIINGINARKQAKEAQRQQNHRDALQNAQALTSAYANQDYIDQYNDKLILKCGGKVRTKAKCGGRKKAAFGLWEDTGTELGNILGGLGNLGSAITGATGLGQLGSRLGLAIGSKLNTDYNNSIANAAATAKQIDVVNTNENNNNIDVNQNNTNTETNNINDVNNNQTNTDNNTQNTNTGNNTNIEKKENKYGGRHRYWLGTVISGVGSIGGALLGASNKSNVQTDDAARYSAPKTGLVNPNWQDIKTNTQFQQPKPIYHQPVNSMYFMGGRKRRR